MCVSMGKDMVDKITEDLIEGLQGNGFDEPKVIYVFGGSDEIRKDVMHGIDSEFESTVTDNSFIEADYSIDLGYFVRKYN